MAKMPSDKSTDEYVAATTTATTIIEEQRRFFLHLSASPITATIEAPTRLVSEPPVPQQDAIVGDEGPHGDDEGSDVSEGTEREGVGTALPLSADAVDGGGSARQEDSGGEGGG